MNSITIIRNEINENPELPFYVNFVNALQKGLKNNTLKANANLPTQRQLAEEPSLSLGTVTRAY